VPAQRNSKPQTQWTVGRQADCLRLVSLLDRHRLIGKKRGEYEIWRRAVLAWTGGQSERHEVIARSRRELRAYRAFENAPGPSRVDITEHSLMAFFAGFVTAEAHLGVTPEGHPFFRINVRADDGYVLRLFRDRLDLGRLVEVPPYGSSCAALSWRIGRLAELRSLTQCLDWYPPRGRVFRIYEACAISCCSRIGAVRGGSSVAKSGGAAHTSPDSGPSWTWIRYASGERDTSLCSKAGLALPRGGVLRPHTRPGARAHVRRRQSATRSPPRSALGSRRLKQPVSAARAAARQERLRGHRLPRLRPDRRDLRDSERRSWPRRRSARRHSAALRGRASSSAGATGSRPRSRAR
jgi:hypothetical protein